MQECTKRNVSTETKFRFHVFQDERFVDLNLYQYGWEQTEPLHSYGPYTKNPNPSPIEKRFGFSFLVRWKGLERPHTKNQVLEDTIMTKLLSCRYSMDTNRVEARFADGITLAIDCIAVEDEYGNTPAQRAELDWLCILYTSPSPRDRG